MARYGRPPNNVLVLQKKSWLNTATVFEYRLRCDTSNDRTRLGMTRLICPDRQYEGLLAGLSATRVKKSTSKAYCLGQAKGVVSDTNTDSIRRNHWCSSP